MPPPPLKEGTKMKRLFGIAIVLCLMATTGIVMAAGSCLLSGDVSVQDEKGKELMSVEYVYEGKKMSAGYLLVKTKSGNEFRIYPCGEVRKLIWKEINPNEEGSSLTAITGANVLRFNNGTYSVAVE